MENHEARAAVGAGTTAGDARDEVRVPESRAAEAEVDAHLESLHVTGAAPVKTEETEAGSGPPPEPHSGIRPEQPREDLRNNQAGIAGRLERAEPRR